MKQGRKEGGRREREREEGRGGSKAGKEGGRREGERERGGGGGGREREGGREGGKEERAVIEVIMEPHPPGLYGNRW